MIDLKAFGHDLRANLNEFRCGIFTKLAVSFLLALAGASLLPDHARASKVVVDDPVYDEYEGDALILALVRDGRLVEARGLLNQRPRKDKDQEQLRLQAEIDFAGEDWKAAITNLRQILEAKNPAWDALTISKLREKLAVSLSQTDQAKACALSFDQVTHKLSSDRIVIQTRCLVGASRPNDAWNLLAKSDVSPILEREKVDLLLKWSLDSVAEDLVLSKIQQNISVTEILQWAELFAGRGKNKPALRILEIARLKAPTQPEVLVAWAQLAHASRFQLATAEAFSLAAASDPKYHFHAAELFRQSGWKSRAFSHAIQIVDGDQKLKHKVALAVDENDYEEISSLAGPIQRSSLLKDDEVKYALGYALLRRGDNTQAIGILQKITNVSLSMKAEALRQSLVPKTN